MGLAGLAERPASHACLCETYFLLPNHRTELFVIVSGTGNTGDGVLDTEAKISVGGPSLSKSLAETSVCVPGGGQGRDMVLEIMWTSNCAAMLVCIPSPILPNSVIMSVPREDRLRWSG